MHGVLGKVFTMVLVGPALLVLTTQATNAQCRMPADDPHTCGFTELAWQAPSDACPYMVEAIPALGAALQAPIALPTPPDLPLAAVHSGRSAEAWPRPFFSRIRHGPPPGTRTHVLHCRFLI